MTVGPSADPSALPPTPLPLPCTPWPPAPLLRAPEGSRTIFTVTALAAMAPLAAGVLLFGYRALLVAVLSVSGCIFLESLYFRVTRAPALADRRHALLTGVLLALTLSPLAPWYVPLVGAAFAILLGKALLGGVGHLIWQPALVGRLAVAVLFGLQLAPHLPAGHGPVLAPAHILTGDVRQCREVPAYYGWRQTDTPKGAHGFMLPSPTHTLRGLTHRQQTRYADMLDVFADLPPPRDLLLGATPGGLGETSVLVILVAGLYLVYRHYVSVVPLMMIIAAGLTAAVAPIRLIDPAGVPQSLWLPVTADGFEPGFAYVSYHLLSGELLLAAFFLAADMTTRPVTRRAQVLFGLGCGLLAMLLRLYGPGAMNAYLAVLMMNTLTPLLNRLTRPRVLGRPAAWRRLLGGPSYIRT